MEIGGQDGQKLRGGRPVGQRARGQLLLKVPVREPSGLGDCIDTAHRTVAGDAVVPGYLWIEPLRGQQQAVRLLGGEINGVSGMEETGMVSGDTEAV